MHAIARLFEPMPRLLLPAAGRHRRCALWLADHGFGVGPRGIHGIEVAR